MLLIQYICQDVNKLKQACEELPDALMHASHVTGHTPQLHNCLGAAWFCTACAGACGMASDV